MLRDVILWLAGVPIVVIILLHLFGVSIETLKRSGSDRPQQPPCRKGKVNRRVGWRRQHGRAKSAPWKLAV